MRDWKCNTGEDICGVTQESQPHKKQEELWYGIVSFARAVIYSNEKGITG